MQDPAIGAIRNPIERNAVIARHWRNAKDLRERWSLRRGRIFNYAQFVKRNAQHLPAAPEQDEEEEENDKEQEATNGDDMIITSEIQSGGTTTSSTPTTSPTVCNEAEKKEKNESKKRVNKQALINALWRMYNDTWDAIVSMRLRK